MLLKTFKVQWVSGRVEFLKGIDITTALIDARHPKSAIRAIKKYEEVLMKKECTTHKTVTEFKKYLTEHITGKGGPTSNQRSKSKRVLRRERKALDKAY